MTKFYLGGLVAFALLIAFLLLLEAKTSDYHAIAVAAMAKSPAVIDSIGKPSTTLLIGSSYKGRSDGPTCVHLNYFVWGEKSLGFIKVSLRKPQLNGDWEIYALVDGIFTASRKPCETD